MSSLTLKTIIDILAFDKKKMDQLFSSLTCLGKRYTIVCILQTKSVYNTNIMLLYQHPVSYLFEILFVPFKVTLGYGLELLFISLCLSNTAIRWGSHSNEIETPYHTRLGTIKIPLWNHCCFSICTFINVKS